MVGTILVALLFVVLCVFFASCKKKGSEPSPYAVVSDDFKTEYYVGEAFTVQGTLKMYTDSDTFTEIPITADMISGFDTSTHGDVIIKVTYGEFNVTVPIHVSAFTAVSLSINEGTLPPIIYQKSSFPSTVTMRVVMSDGSVREAVPVTAQMLGGFNSSILGAQTVTIGYLGASTSVSVTIKADVRTSIELIGGKTAYAVGEPLSLADAVLQVSYESGKKVSVTPTAEMISGFSTALGGSFRAKVTYVGLECDFLYNVQKKPASFALIRDTLPNSFEKGDAFPEGGTGVLTYDDGTTDDVSLSASNAPSFDTSTAGEKSIPINAFGLAAAYSYTVLPAIESATPYGYTSAVQQGSAFDGLGELIVVYENGARESIALSSDRLTIDFQTTETGDVAQTIRLRRTEIPFDVYVYSAEEKNKVESIELFGSFSPIVIGESLKMEGIRIRINYSYLSPTITDCNPEWARIVMPASIDGDYEDLPVTISCFGAETTGSVRVLSEQYASRVTSLTPIGFKTLYVMGESLSLENATLAVTFGGGYDFRQGVLVAAEYITDFDTSMSGGRSMTVTYGGYSVSLDYFVIPSEVKDQVTDFMIYGFDPLLFEGDDIFDIDVSSYALTLTLGYGYSSETIPLSLDMLSGGPFVEEGIAEVTVTYEDVVRAFSVNVRPESDRSVVTSISVPDTIRSYVGTPPDFSTANLEVTYGYGYEKRVIPLSSDGVNISPYSIAAAGYVRVVVTYEGVTCDAILSFVAGGSENLLQGISISSDSRSEFAVGEALDGVYLITTYNGDRRPEKVAVDVETMAPDFESAEAGKYTITISYGGRAVVYAYTVTEGEAQEG